MSHAARTGPTVIEPIVQLWHQLWAIPHIRIWLTALWLVYLVGLGGYIVLQKREPAATLSWLLGLATLPYIGFVVYHVFGPQKIARHRLRRQARHVRLSDVVDGGDAESTELARLGLGLTGLPPSSAREVRWLVDGAAKYDALLEDLAQATRQVHMEYYIYDPDESGTAIRDALVACARRGVKVRLLLDAVGAKKVTQAWMRPLVEAGGELAWFHPVKWGRFWKRPWLNMRNHRKIVVIDGRIAYTGGMNVSNDQNERLKPDAYRDLHMRLVGDVVRALQLVFVEDWAYATGKTDFIGESKAALAPAQPGPISAQVVVSGPDSEWEAIHRVHVSAIHAATRRVWLVTPYFVPGEAAMMALTSAAKAGLDVRLLVPRMSDSRLVTYAARSYYTPLLESGVRIYEYGPRMLHTKAMVCDGDVALVGSANFDHRSFRLNFEVQVLFRDAGVAGELASFIESEFSHAPRVVRATARPLRERLPEALARLVSPLL